MSQREEAEEEGVHPTEPPLCGQPESQTGAQSPEQQRPESAGRRMDVEDNVSTESLPEIKLSNLDIWCLPYPFDPLADEVTIDDVISPLDPKGSPSRTSSGYTSTSSLSFKSDGSKDNTIINFKERRSILIPEQQRPESAGLRMTGKKNRSTDRHRLHDRIRLHKKRLKRTRSMGPIPDFIEHSNRSPEQQRPESAGRRMAGRRNRSTFLRRLFAIHSLLELLLKETVSLIHDFKESSNLSPEQQRPESAGRRMDVEDNVSTDRLTVPAFHSRLQDRLKRTRSMCRIPDIIERSNRSGYSSTSSLSFKSDGSKDTITDFKEGSSTLIPEQQRPESAGLRMNVEDNRSTDRLRSNDKWDILQSRTSSGYPSTSSLSFKRDESKDIIIDLKGMSSFRQAFINIKM